MQSNSNTYNRNFDNATNNYIDKLVKRLPNKQLPRINKKNEESAFDPHLAYIVEKLSENKTQSQILSYLNFKFKLSKTKSALSRFVSKKLGGVNEKSK
jgi:hypothetical protein